MSSENADAEADRPAVAEDDADLPELAQVAPNDFLDRWGASSYEEGVEKAEQAETSTPPEKIKRCPHADCLSQRIRRKTQKHDGQTDKDAEYRCTHCSRHFDDPIVGEPDSADELIVVDTETDEADEDDDADTEGDPFVWVSEEDLAEPPFPRQLAALDDDVLTALAIYCYRPWNHTEADPSYRELSRIFPYSRDWVGERVREWKRGAHREKVADPRPPLTAASGAEGVAAE